MASDLKVQVGKFLGTWVYESDENYDKFLAASGENEDTIKYIMSMKPKSEFTVDSDGQLHSISYPMPKEKPDFKFDIKFKLDEPFDWKFKDEHMDEDWKITAKLLKGNLTYDVVPNDGKKKGHNVLEEIVDGKLVETLTCGSVVGKLIYKKE